MDAEYLQQNIGSCLSQCLADVCMKRPNDPIEYIAHWLYKHIDNVNAKKQVISLLVLSLILSAEVYEFRLKGLNIRLDEAKSLRTHHLHNILQRSLR